MPIFGEDSDGKEAAVSVAIEEFTPHDWAEKVYRSDILEGRATLSKKPGYNPFSPKEEEKKENDTANLTAYLLDAAARSGQEDVDGSFILIKTKGFNLRYMVLSQYIDIWAKVRLQGNTGNCPFGHVICRFKV